MEKRIGFLGPIGTFTHEAAEILYQGEKNHFLPYKSVPEVLDSTANGEVDYGVVPIENSIEGSVNLTLDWLIHEVDVSIFGELILPINQHLLLSKDQDLQEITKILSHPQAIAHSAMTSFVFLYCTA